MSACCVQPSNTGIKEGANPVEANLLMHGFSTLKSRLIYREGHICPNCDTIGVSGNYCNTCHRLIPFNAQSEFVPNVPSELGYYLNFVFKKSRSSVAMSKRYETKVQNGLLIMTRRRTKNEPSSEPDRKKVRTSSSTKSTTGREKMINRFVEIASRSAHRPASSRQRDGTYFSRKSASRDSSNNASSRDSTPKKGSGHNVEVTDNRINLPGSKAVRRTDSVAVVAPYFGEKPATKIFVSSEPIPRNSEQEGNQPNPIIDVRQRPVIQRQTLPAESVLHVSPSNQTINQSQLRPQSPPSTVVLSTSPNQARVQTPLQSHVSHNVQNSQSVNQTRQQMQIQLVVSNTQAQEHSISQTQSIQTTATVGTPVQRAVVPGRLQPQIQIRRPIRPPNRRAAVQLTRPGSGTTVVANQALLNLPGRVVYVQQPVAESVNTNATSVSSVVRNSPVNQVTGQTSVRPATATTGGTSQISPSVPDSPGPESDELVIIGLSGVSRTPVVTRTTTTAENAANNRASSQQGQNAKYIEKFVYAPNGNDGITLTNEDVLLLNAECYLNDVLIDFYLKYVYHAQLTAEQQRVTYTFNSFFYTRLTQKMPTQGDFTQGHASVAKWTRRVDLFTKDFVLIPINENSHWFLAIICFPWLVGTINYAGLLGGQRDPRTTGSAALDLTILNDAQRSHYRRLVASGIEPMPCILMFDSLIGQSRSPNVKILRDYLQCEWNLKSASELGNRFFNKDTIRGFSPKVPQQPNGYDCGVFVLNYAELFYRRPVKSFTKGYFQNEMDGWFEIGEVRQKRLDIRNLIIDLWRGCQTEMNASSH